MTDFESRLRAAMAASAEPPPARLLDGIYLRHRRHVRRVVTACAAVVAVGVAGAVGTRGILAGPGGSGPPATGPAVTGPANSPSAGPTSTVTAVPQTVLRDCQSNNSGTVSSDWKAHSVHAGPVWFVYARPTAPSPSHRMPAGKVNANAMIIAIRNGGTAVVTAAPALAGRIRFLGTFNGDGSPYTLAEGAPRLRLAGCPASPAASNVPAAYAPGLTMFWQGYVTDLGGCISLEVRTSPASKPIRVTVAGVNGGCHS